MAFSTQEQEIIKFGVQSGKGRAEVEEALKNFRLGIQPKKEVVEAPQQPSALERVGERIGEAGEKVYQNIAGEGEFANQSPLRRGVQATAEAFNAIPGTAYAALPKTGRSMLDIAGGLVSAPFKALSDAIGGIPALQKWVTNNPEAAKNLEEIAGVASAGGQIAGNILLADQTSKLAQLGADKAVDIAKAGAETAKESLKGVSDVTGKLYKSTSEAMFPKLTPKEAAAQVLQSKKKLTPSQIEAFKEIDLSTVTTFDDLLKNTQKSIPRLAGEVDDVLRRDPTRYSLEQLGTQTKTTGGQVVKTNYIENALKQLREAYKNSADDVKVAEIDNIYDIAKTQGLTKLEVNNLSRIYNSEFKTKAFSKTGEPLTSTNAVAFENTRTGLKDVARRGVAGTEAEAIDKTLSNIYNIRDLVEKSTIDVRKLRQKINDRGLLEQVGHTVSKYADILSGGSIRGFVAGLLPRGAGYKTMNALDLEAKLVENLKTIEKALNSNSDEVVKSQLRQLDLSNISPAKPISQSVPQTTASQGNAMNNSIVTATSVNTPGFMNENEAQADSTTTDEIVKQTYAQMPQLDPTGMVGVGGAVARIAGRLLPEDAATFIKFIDHVRNKAEIPESWLVAAEHMAERMGGPIQGSLTKLADWMEDVVRGKINADVLYKTGRKFKGE